jgi:hypothetical protein
MKNEGIRLRVDDLDVDRIHDLAEDRGEDIDEDQTEDLNEDRVEDLEDLFEALDEKEKSTRSFWDGRQVAGGGVCYEPSSE